MTVHRSLTGLLGTCLVLVFVTPVAADESPPKPPAGALGLIRDMRLTLLARRALQNDRILAPLNLGVRVRNGIAELWGEVPSEEVARQAVAKIETVTGVIEVKPSLQARPSVPAAERVEVAKPVGDTGQLKRLPPAPPLSVGTAMSHHRPGAPQAALAARTPPQRQAVLLPPRAVEPAARADQAPGRPASLADAVERIRTSQARFRSVPVRIEGTVIVLRRGQTTDDDVTDLAQQLRTLPGVTEVRLADE